MELNATLPACPWLSREAGRNFTIILNVFIGFEIKRIENSNQIKSDFAKLVENGAAIKPFLLTLGTDLLVHV